jgi:dihydropteroate synthase
MTDKPNRDEQILKLVEEFIAVANRLKDEGHHTDMVNTAFMIASAQYATFLAVGNTGYLKESGVRKVARAYEHNLQLLQNLKKAQYNPEGKD